MFILRLALAMRRVDADRMLGEISARQLTEWAAFERVHGPFGEERGDLRSAQVVQIVANALRGRRAPYRLADCVLKFGRESPTIRGDWRSLRAYLLGMTAAVGGEVSPERMKELGRGEVNCGPERQDVPG